MADEPKSKKEKKDSSLSDAAAKLGHEGGLKGGPARAESLSAEERKKIAEAGAKARWSGTKHKINKKKKPKGDK